MRGEILAAALLLGVLVPAAVVVPVTGRVEPAARSPLAAAVAGEAEIPPLGLVWGKVRGWVRSGEGWEVVWQPAHGSWLVRAWLADAGEVRWGLEAAPWLPGARLSRDAARLLAGEPVAPAVPQERLGRRDWAIGERRVLGALDGGRRLPFTSRDRDTFWPAIVAGLLFAGAIVRAVFPAPVALGWRRAVVWLALGLAAIWPWLSPLAGRSFHAGARPWVAELVFGATCALVLGGLAIAAARYPAVKGKARAWLLAVALAVGVLAGRMEPVTWMAEVGGLTVRLGVWACLVVLVGWLAGLAGEGLRHLLEIPRGLRPWLLVAAAVAAVPSAGEWLGVVLAAIVAGATARGQGTPVACAVLLGWVVGATWATCAWLEPVRDSLLLLLAGCAVILALALREVRGAATG